MRALAKYILMLAATAVCSCSGSDVTERLSSAEMAYATEDAAMSRRICDEIMDDDSGSEERLTAMQYGRLSILYMQLYDRTDDADALDKAAKCYREAYDVNGDSAAYFYTHLPVEQDKYGMSLSMLVQSMDNPADISDCHDSESGEEGYSVDSIAR